MPSKNMVNLKNVVKTDTAVISDNDGYPWGTRIHLEDDVIEQLGVEALAVGDTVVVVAIAEVKSKSEYADDENTSRSLTLQLTDMEVKRQDPDTAEQLYG